MRVDDHAQPTVSGYKPRITWPGGQVRNPPVAQVRIEHMAEAPRGVEAHAAAEGLPLMTLELALLVGFLLSLLVLDVAALRWGVDSRAVYRHRPDHQSRG